MWFLKVQVSYSPHATPFARTQAKILIVKFRLLSKETSVSGISKTFFLFMGNYSNTDYKFLW